ncbi:hypothetical protein SLEP1_g30133 [Rubroshorea leprosula]|uniref:Phosphoglycerate mutase n=1 Tax=Rubroshorea leprosula TaxID=152421 RepID=A0AAV5K720_9ROSI|nr:hypothetical protein SLEP1_g30133 [Rubroshorea leprosula]
MDATTAHFPYAWHRCKILHLGLRPCDMRRRVSEYQSLFPSLDYSMMDGEEDNLWIPDVRESEEELAERGMKLMKWLWTRPEKEIAVVSHGIVLQHMLYVLGNDCENTALFKRFDNCELRSVHDGIGLAENQQQPRKMKEQKEVHI